MKSPITALGSRCCELLAQARHLRVTRVVVGLLHPLAHLRGGSVRALRAAGVTVDVLGEAACPADSNAVEECRRACLQANEVDTSLARC